MSAPKRIQLKRTKGWRKPEGAVVVSRPSRWGNPFKIGTEFYRFDGGLQKVGDRQTAVDLFREFRVQRILNGFALLNLSEIRGHDLACWCPLDQPCHADVLLEIANA